MQDFEKLGLFYLGRRHDLATRKTTAEPVLYDSKDLVTHAVCMGMTGSGKTGLCLGILEEAALDGIPAIAIDPKGDLGNLLLTFPSLAGPEFRPWVDPDEARRADASLDQFAEDQARVWREGLAAWGEDADRIRRLKAAADFAIYTPGSTAGLPVSILKSFDPPAERVRGDVELLTERANTTTTSLLTLAGVDGDELRSRQHILIATLLTAAWKEGRALDLAALIGQIQNPPVARVGVLELDAFYPAKERFELAAGLNNLLAAPGFDVWLQGDPLDVDRLLYTSSGKPRMSIVSIAHLGETERMFFVALLLNEVIGWMRTQPGTDSLRAILYMDEIAGYFPPVAMPASKAPLMRLLKQARAFGLGVVLATQNPVDLDYKGLSNTGTWLIGRLQTERDQARVLDALEGTGGATFDRGEVERTIAGLGKRIFLMHNVHEASPVTFESRWTMSYLRGPLTREQIRQLAAAREAEPEAAQPATATPRASEPQPARPPRPAPAAGGETSRPVLDPDIQQFFMPAAASEPVYEPCLYGTARVRFTDAKRGVDVVRDLAYAAPFGEGATPIDWVHAEPVETKPADLEREPPAGASFAPLPPAAGRQKSYEAWTKDFARWVAQTQAIEVWRSADLGLTSEPGESERDFRLRLKQTVRERRDREVEKVRQKFAAKVAAQNERIRRAEQAHARESEQASQQKVQTAVSMGATILGAFFGRKTITQSTLGRATTSARGVSRSMKEAQDVERAARNVEAEQQKLHDIETDVAAAIAAIDAGADPQTLPLDTVAVKPKRGDVAVQLVALVWRPA
jgi:hypothetical protein